MKNVLILLFCMTVTACAHQNTSVPASQPVAVSTPDDVRARNCRMLGDVHGVSGLYGAFAAKALKKSRAAAIHQVEQLGGNTVVWIGFNTPHGSTSVDGYAYACPT